MYQSARLTVALMLWEVPLTPPQGTRCFSVADSFHFIQVIEVKLSNTGTVKFFLWRQDSVLSRFHLRQILLYFYLSRMWGWRGSVIVAGRGLDDWGVIHDNGRYFSVCWCIQTHRDPSSLLPTQWVQEALPRAINDLERNCPVICI
jgi:hypothetical protein